MRWTSPFRSAKPQRQLRTRRPVIEALEDRRLLATINWTNPLDPSFNVYGANAASARAIVGSSIDYWGAVIDRFNYENVGQEDWAPVQNRFDLQVVVADLGGSTLGQATASSRYVDPAGKPFQGLITMDDDARTANPSDIDGWYFDTSLGDDFEFVNPITPFASGGGPAGYDFLSTMVHEIGHSLGITDLAEYAISARLSDFPAPPPERIFTFLDNSVILMTNQGGLHTWPATHRNDLMTSSSPPSERRLISDLDARILADSYGYTVNWEQIDLRSFVTSYNPTTRQLRVNGDLGTTYDQFRVFDDIYLNVAPDFIRVYVNGRLNLIAPEAVSSIFVVGGNGNDEVRVESTRAGQPLIVNGGAGDNSVFLSSGLHNLLHIQGDVSVVEQGGNTNVILRDESNTAARNFQIGTSFVTFSGSNARVQHYYGDARDVDRVTINGGSGGNFFVMDNNFSPTSMFIFAGAGNDDVRVIATGLNGLSVDGVAGSDKVTVGASIANGLRDINGSVRVSNSTGYTELKLDDSGDFNASGDVRISDTEVSGLGPARVTVDPRGISTLFILASNGIFAGNQVTVLNTPQNRAGSFRTTINTGRYNDVVNVLRTSSSLTINGERGTDAVNIGENASMQGIRGVISLTNFGGFTDLLLNDAAGPTSRDVSLGVLASGSGYVRGLALGAVNFRERDLRSLTIRGGYGGNRFTVQDTPQNIPGTLAMRLNTGAGTDTVQVWQTTSALPIDGGGGLDSVTIGRSGRLGDIAGSIDVFNPPDGGYTALTINGANDAVSRTFTLDPGSVTGLAPAQIRFAPADLRALTVSAGSGGNNVTVINTPQNGLGTVAVVLNTGLGADVVNLQRAASTTTVNGQRGADIVNVGFSGNMQGVTAQLTVTNAGNWSTLNLENSADTLPRTVTMNVVGNFGTVAGLAPALIRYRRSDLRALNVWGGSGNNTFDVRSTAQSTIAGGSPTTLSAGSGSDTIYVTGTQGSVFIDPQGNFNQITIGERPGVAGSLAGIRGDVTLRGEEGVHGNFVDIVDRLNARPSDYTMDAQRLYRTLLVNGAVTGNIDYGGLPMDGLDIVGGSGANQYFVNSTPAANPAVVGGGVNVLAGIRNDSVTVFGSSGQLNVNLGSGVDQRIAIGDATHALDAVLGEVIVTGGGFIDAYISDEASTTQKIANIRHNVANGQIVERYDFALVDGAYPKLNTFRFAFADRGRVNYQTGQTGGGGYYNHVDVYGVPANTEIVVSGGPDYDVFTAGFGTDLSTTLGPVTFLSPQADIDFAYCYDYFNLNPQTYTVHSNPLDSSGVLVERPGMTPITYNGLTQLVFYSPLVGDGTTINVLSNPANLYLNMVVGDNDRVTLGSSAPNLGGTMSDIRGPVAVGSFTTLDVVTLTLDDSGNTTTARDVAISPHEPGQFGLITGLSGSSLLFRDYENYIVDVRGGALDDRFLMSGHPLNANITIDGGAGNDILVGNGGNVLKGGLGRDLLIAGALASILEGGADEDILVGGRLNDISPANLAAIMAEWTSAGGYDARVANLRAGLLADDKVTGNGGGNSLTGGSDALDLFFGSLVTDWQEDEEVVPV